MANQSKNQLVDDITKYLCNQLSERGGGAHTQNIKVTDYFFRADCLRLRKSGYQLLKLFFENEEFEHDRKFNYGELLLLSRNLNSPYFINERKIVLFGDEQIVMAKLTGNVALWIENIG
jgi:hypothetical protein